MYREKDCFYSDKQKASSHHGQIVNAVLLLYILFDGLFLFLFFWLLQVQVFWTEI